MIPINLYLKKFKRANDTIQAHETFNENLINSEFADTFKLLQVKINRNHNKNSKSLNLMNNQISSKKKSKKNCKSNNSSCGLPVISSIRRPSKIDKDINTTHELNNNKIQSINTLTTADNIIPLINSTITPLLTYQNQKKDNFPENLKTIQIKSNNFKAKPFNCKGNTTKSLITVELKDMLINTNFSRKNNLKEKIGYIVQTSQKSIICLNKKKKI